MLAFGQRRIRLTGGGASGARAGVVLAAWYGLMAAFSLAAQEQPPSVNLPLGHFVYDFVERLETQGVIDRDIRWRNRPFSRNAVVRLIDEIDAKRKDGLVLSGTERELFEKLKGEFHVELAGTDTEIPTGEKEKHLIHWKTTREGASGYVIGDVVVEQDVEGSRFAARGDSLDETVSNTTVSGVSRGVVMNALAFYADFRSTMIKGSDIESSNFRATQLGVINRTNNVYSLEANAYIVAEPKCVRIQFGKDKLSLGPSPRNNLMLSGNAPAFDNLRLDVTFDRIKFTYFHGWLRSERLTFNDRGDSTDRKYMVGHRLEFKVFPWLFLAGNESVIYGGRPLETQYLNPIMVYHIAEQYSGDKDNNTISFDATAFPARGLKLYASLFLDDYRLADNPFTYWKQTWAAQAGVFWVNPLCLEDTDVRLEYTRIEPFVYAHKWDLINYSHFEQSLGSFLPPNSDNYFLEIQHRPSRRLNVGVHYELTRHGEGDIAVSGEELGYGQPGKVKKEFLMGVKEIKHAVGVNGRMETFHNHYAYLFYEYQHIKRFENVANRNASRHNFLIGYRLDY